MNGMIGEVIYSLRKKKGMTQADLAEKVGVSSQAVSKWETEDANPDTTILPELAKALDTTVGVLFGEKEAHEKNRARPLDVFLTSSIICFAFTLLATASLCVAFAANWEKLVYSQYWIFISLALLVVSLTIGFVFLKKYASRL